MLHRRRERLRSLAEKEAAGGDFWTEKFNGPVRIKIKLAFDDLTQEYSDSVAMVARDLILRDEGMLHLHDTRYSAYDDLTAYLIRCTDDMVPTVIEAMAAGIGTTYGLGRSEQFQAAVRIVLREYRIKFDLLDAEMVPLNSLVMHREVVEPVLTLLRGDARFGKVNAAFRAALGEISDGQPADAITDAGTALQELLVELGCAGNALGPLIKSAKSNNLLASHDTPILEALERAAHWVSADRSARGDSHVVTNVTLDDAWLTVHIVGAFILRLGGEPRG